MATTNYLVWSALDANTRWTGGRSYSFQQDWIFLLLVHSTRFTSDWACPMNPLPMRTLSPSGRQHGEGVFRIRKCPCLAYAAKLIQRQPEKEQLLVNLSGRGDKDTFTVDRNFIAKRSFRLPFDTSFHNYNKTTSALSFVTHAILFIAIWDYSNLSGKWCRRLN